MIKTFFSVFSGIFSLFKYPLYFIITCFCIFFFLVCLNIMISLFKGKRFKKGVHNVVKKKSIFWRLFVDAPKQYVADMFERSPEFFKHQGLIIFEGRQGSGKTVSMVEYALRLQEEYPLAKCISNLGYLYEDDKLEDWRMLLDYKNDIRGVIVMMDELQNWFSSNDSKNFPPEMLTVVTQNRKNRRVILGTSQNFYMLAKAIRTQATEVRRCATFLGCLTFVRRFEPILDSEGSVVEFKPKGMYFFVHNKKIREAYDTYKVIDNLSKSGFQERMPAFENNNYLYLDIKNKKGR